MPVWYKDQKPDPSFLPLEMILRESGNKRVKFCNNLNDVYLMSNFPTTGLDPSKMESIEAVVDSF